MKTTFKLDSLAFTIDGQPIELKGIEHTTEASSQELATAGANINKLVEIIGDIAERFDNNTPTPVVKEIEVQAKEDPKPVKVKQPKITDFCEVKEKTEKTELPTSEWHGGEPKKGFNLTKAWREIPVPEEMEQKEPDKYRWLGKQYPLADSVTVDGGTYGAVYIHINSMHKTSFIIVRPENVKFEDDVKPEEFQDFLEAINIPNEIKDYIKKVIEL